MDTEGRRRTRQENLARIGAKGSKGVVLGTNVVSNGGTTPLVAAKPAVAAHTAHTTTHLAHASEPEHKKPALEKENSNTSFVPLTIHGAQKTEAKPAEYTKREIGKKTAAEPIYDVASNEDAEMPDVAPVTRPTKEAAPAKRPPMALPASAVAAAPVHKAPAPITKKKASVITFGDSMDEPTVPAIIAAATTATPAVPATATTTSTATTTAPVVTAPAPIPRSQSVSAPMQTPSHTPVSTSLMAAAAAAETADARGRSKTVGSQDTRKRVVSMEEVPDTLSSAAYTTPRKDATVSHSRVLDTNVVCSTPRSKEVFHRLLDGSKNMIEALKNASPTRAVTALHEKVVNEQALEALETDAPSAGEFTRAVRISEITVPLNWMWLEQHQHSQKKRTVYHVFMTFQIGASVLATGVVQADGSREESRLIFPEKFLFDNVTSDTEVEVRVFSFATEKKDTTASTPGRLVKEVTTPIKAKASEMRSKIIKLIHPTKSQESIGLTPKKHSSSNLEFSQIGKATFKLGQLVKTSTQQFARGELDADSSPVGSTINMLTSIESYPEQAIRREGTLTVWDDTHGRMGEWVRCKARLEDGSIRFFRETSGDLTERFPMAQFSLPSMIDAKVSKIAKTECARPNSFVITSAKGDVIFKAAADSKDERDSWMTALTRNIFDLKTWTF